MPIEPPIETPRTLGDAYAILASGPHRPIAGGTDVMVQITGEIGPPPDRMIDLWALDELRGIAVEGGAVTLGALTTYTQIRRSAVCREHLPGLVEAAATIGAAQIQNRGTIGGNVANASPAGDTLPVLLATDAEIVVGGAHGERTIPVEDFWVAYRKTALAPDELVVRIRIPLVAGREVRFRKIGTRRAQAISKVVMAAVRGPRPRIALGSVAPTVIRLSNVERALSDGADMNEAVGRLDEDIRPIDDLRSTGAYRRDVAANLLRRFWAETV